MGALQDAIDYLEDRESYFAQHGPDSKTFIGWERWDERKADWNEDAMEHLSALVSLLNRRNPSIDSEITNAIFTPTRQSF